MAGAGKQMLELFYDVISPYSWLAFEVLTRYKTKWNIDLVLRPVFLGGIMQGSDNKPPGYVPKKFVHMTTDLERLRKHFNIPINFPSNPAEVIFNKGSLSAMRFLTAVSVNYPEHVENLSRELWMRIWSRDEDITQPDSFVQQLRWSHRHINGECTCQYLKEDRFFPAAAKKAGLSEAVITDALLKIKEQAIKDTLKGITEEALGHGAFGAPTIVAHVDGKTEMVFGSDRFHILAEILGETYEGPLTHLNKAKL